MKVKKAVSGGGPTPMRQENCILRVDMRSSSTPTPWLFLSFKRGFFAFLCLTRFPHATTGSTAWPRKSSRSARMACLHSARHSPPPSHLLIDATQLPRLCPSLAPLPSPFNHMVPLFPRSTPSLWKPFLSRKIYNYSARFSNYSCVCCGCTTYHYGRHEPVPVRRHRAYPVHR